MAMTTVALAVWVYHQLDVYFPFHIEFSLGPGPAFGSLP